MGKLIDPGYLRAVFDGLDLGVIRPDNIGSLPDGLAGVFEEAFPANQPFKEREELLSFFLCWAVVRKEVSATFASELLEIGEEEVVERISRHSKWFNSPSNGKYILYHERLRVFLLQRSTNHQFDLVHNRLIGKCEDALRRRAGDEWESYALEFLSSHLLVPALMDKGAGKQLRDLAYSQSHWNRQLEVSKGYSWSNRMLDEMMMWAAKSDGEEVIECALKKVNLYHLEQNDAYQIVALVARNEIEAALDRIESFGGNDGVGLRRKFILYMLCLMELTLLESRDKPFAKDHIERLLQHLDENLRVDHSILKWDDFFPSYLVFLMVCRWTEMGLDYMVVYRRTDRWYTRWISENDPYTDLQLQLLLELARGISDQDDRSFALRDISTELAKQGKVTEALETAQGINDEIKKISALGAISKELAKQGKGREALETAGGISDEREKSYALREISTELVNELAKQGKVTEALETARGISDEMYRDRALEALSTELAKQGKVTEALKTVRGISGKPQMSSAIVAISSQSAKQGKIKEALDMARGISDENDKSSALWAISTELAKQGKVTEALETVRGVSDEWQMSSALAAISTELSKQRKVREADTVMLQALETARGISDEMDRDRALEDISTELAKQGKVREALKTTRGISEKWGGQKSGTLVVISRELAKQGKFAEAIDTLRGLEDEFEREWGSALVTISSELAEQGKIKEADALIMQALGTARGSSDERQMSFALATISSELANQGKVTEANALMMEAHDTAQGISDEFGQRSSALREISTELAKQGKVTEALETAGEISKDYLKIPALVAISTELAKQGKITEALRTARGISDEGFKCSALATISSELAKQKKVREADAVMLEALKTARKISKEYRKSIVCRLLRSGSLHRGNRPFHFYKPCLLLRPSADVFHMADVSIKKSSALATISSELAKQGKVTEALKTARGISDERQMSFALATISSELAKQGKVTEALEMARGISDEGQKRSALVAISTELAKQGKVTEALETARWISDENDKSSALRAISTELAKQGNLTLAEEIGLEFQSTADRHKCWTDIASGIFALKGAIESLPIGQSFYSDEARLFYQQGWSQALIPKDANDDLLNTALPQLASDPISLKNILQAHALYCIFFVQADKQKTHRINQVLDIQWAVDIAARFPKPS